LSGYWDERVWGNGILVSVGDTGGGLVCQGIKKRSSKNPNTRKKIKKSQKKKGNLVMGGEVGKGLQVERFVHQGWLGWGRIKEKKGVEHHYS